jgi:hypothetical protein
VSAGRSGALAGVVYVVLDVVVGVLAGSPPALSASESEIAAYVAGHGSGLAAGLWLFGLASVALLWWCGSWWRLMVEAEDGSARLAVVSLAGLVLGGAMAFASAVVMASLPLVRTQTSLAPLYTVGALFLSAAGFGLAVHILAGTVVAVRGSLLAAAWAVVGAVAAVAFLVSAVLGPLSKDATSNTLSLLGFVLWLLWILAISRRMWVADAEVVRAPQRQTGATSRL